MTDLPTEGHRPIINILGDQVALGPPRRDLLPTYERWMNDFDTLYLAGYIPGPRTVEALAELFVHELQDGIGDTGRYRLAMVSTDFPRVPAPGAAAVMSLGLLALARRRR